MIVRLQTKDVQMHAAAAIGMVVGILLGAFVVTAALVIWRPPAFVIRYLRRRWPEVLWEVDTKQRIVALTIDDGPSSYTQETFEILKGNGATATFFVIGSHIPGKEHILQQLASNGHELGNHALYDEPSWKLSDDQLSSQIKLVDQQIRVTYESCSLPMPRRYFRPGSGFFTKRLLHTVASLGHQLVLGSIYPHDPQISSVRLNTWHILSSIRPGAIIICHDGRPWTAPMLRGVLPVIRQKGYKVVCLSELLANKQIPQLDGVTH